MNNKTNDNIKVMVAGHICLDITPGFDPSSKGDFNDILSPGKLVNVEGATVSTGGTVSNTGLSMAKLGLDVTLNGKVGDDAFGAIIKDVVGLDRASSFKTAQGQSSSYSIVLSLPGVDRIFLHHPGTNDTFTAEDIDYDQLSQCALLSFGYPTLMQKMYENNGQELKTIFKKTKALGVLTSLDTTLPDPNSPSGQANWQAIFKEVLPYVDLFLPSIEEIAYMLNRDLFEKRKSEANGQDPVLSYTGADCTALSNKLLALGVKVIAIKMGINGYYIRTANRDVLNTLEHKPIDLDAWANREIWASSYQAQKFGAATGAGDATIAGFLTAFLNGLDPVCAVKAANTLGWQNVREVDTLSGVEDWPTTMAMIKDDTKKRNPLTIDIDGWRFSDSDQVYYGPNDNGNN